MVIYLVNERQKVDVRGFEATLERGAITKPNIDLLLSVLLLIEPFRLV